MYAIIKTGGKQYKITEGNTIVVEKLDGEVDGTIEITEVLAVSGENGLQVGTPTVAGARVVARIVEHGKNKKINGFTYKPKKNEHRRYGHRQPNTQLLIESIEV